MIITTEIIDVICSGAQTWEQAAKDAYNFAFAYHCTVRLTFSSRTYLINKYSDYDLLLTIN